MRLFRPESLLDSGFVDPASRFYCHVFTAPIAVGAEVAADAAIPAAAIGAADVGAGALGGFSALGGADIAGLTAADIGAGTAADIGAGAGALGGFSSLAGPDIAGLTAADIGAGAGGLGAAIEGVGGGTGLDAALGAGGDVASGLVPGGALTTGVTAAPTAAAPALSAGTAVGGPVAAAPALPASVGDAPTVTGDLASVSDGGIGADYGGGGDLATGSGGGTTAAGTTAAGTGTKGGFFDRAISSLTGGALNKSDLGTILSAGGLGLNLLRSGQSLPGEKQLSGAASNLGATAAGQAALGSQLEGFLQSGTLPPGLEAGLRSATGAAQARIRSMHAAQGTSGSSAEASEIQAASDAALAAGQQVALQLLQQGASMVQGAVSTEGLAANLYQTILANALEKDRELGSSIGNFASALARSGSTTTTTTTPAA